MIDTRPRRPNDPEASSARVYPPLEDFHETSYGASEGDSWAVIFSFAPYLALAEEVTKETVIEFVKRSSDHVQKVGIEQAYKDFGTPGNEWHKGDLYIFVFKYEGQSNSWCQS